MSRVARNLLVTSLLALSLAPAMAQSTVTASAAVTLPVPSVPLPVPVPPMPSVPLPGGTVSFDLQTVQHQWLDAKLKAAGFAVAYSADGHVEVAVSANEVYSVQVEAAANGPACTDASKVCLRVRADGKGTFEVSYADGTMELARPQAHSTAEASFFASQRGFSVVASAEGETTVREDATGRTLRVVFDARLTRGEDGKPVGLRFEANGEVVIRYTDGMEQRVIIIGQAA